MKRFKNILYVSDSSGLIVKAFHHAVNLAERNNAMLTVLLVNKKIPLYVFRMLPHMLRKIRIEQQQAALDKLCGWVGKRVKIESRIVEGTPFIEIIREVIRNNHDLVIKSAEHEGGAFSQLFGTTDMHLLRKCHCPVWLIKSMKRIPIQRVMAAVDFGELDQSGQDTNEPLNRMILEMAGSAAFLERSELHVVHVWDAFGEDLMVNRRVLTEKKELAAYVEEVRLAHEQQLDQLMHKARKWIGPDTYDSVKPRVHLLKGTPDILIPKFTRDKKVDLIVMATVMRTGIPGLIIGSTAESILSRIDCSVLVVKPESFVTPVTVEE